MAWGKWVGGGWLALAGLAAAAEVAELGEVTVSGRTTRAEQWLAPNTSEGMTRQQLDETTNVVNTEDAFKYLPDVLVRKRYIGDTDAPIAGRTTGINASARSLVYADAVLLTPLINNNNGNGSPRWFMVAPEEIERVDVLYGPFSAAYPGNAYGLVANVTTRLPEKFEGSVKLTGSQQDFAHYASRDSYRAGQLAATLGQRIGDFAFWLSANHLDSRSQPMSFAYAPAASGAAGTAVGGNIADRNRTGGVVQAIGAGGLTQTVQDNFKVKLAYDLSPRLRAAYTFGLWQNVADITAETYLRDASGAPYWGATAGQASFGGANYSASALAALFQPGHREMEHHMQSLTLRDKGDGLFAWDAAFSSYEYVRHQERTAQTGTAGTYAAMAGGSGAGRTVDMAGTGWSTADVGGQWRPQGHDGRHVLNFGVHHDRYRLVSPTYNTTGSWLNAPNGSLYADARGKTETQALWLQDAIRLTGDVQATLGVRQEWWRAFAGSNMTGGVTVDQPGRSESAVSPKLALAWAAAPDWQISAALGRAVRFPTVGELYSTIQVAPGVYQSSTPNLKSERVDSGELAVEHSTDGGRLRLSLFEERVSDAIISQSSTHPLTGAVTSFLQNVERTRQRGVELVARQDDVLLRGLELSGSLSYVDARIVADAGTPAAVGKRTPYVPDWRATVVATWRPDAHWSYTLAGRYSGRMYATVDNSDSNPHTYQGFERFFVADLRVRYQVDRRWSAALGVDNLNNRNYFLFHPFPQRTAYAELKFDF